MALRRSLALLQLPTSLRTAATPACTQCRSLHALNKPSPRIPPPLPFVPDVPTFLTLIGRDMIKHEAKIPSWEALFTLSSEQLKESGLEPPRARRYLLWWRERFRRGIYGVGGDVKHTTKIGNQVAAELRIVQVPESGRKQQQQQQQNSTSPATLTNDAGVGNLRITRVGKSGQHSPATLTKDAGYVKVISNMRPHFVKEIYEGKVKELSILNRLAPSPIVQKNQVSKVKGMKIAGSNTIAGTGVEYIRGRKGVAVLKTREGLWEQRRGHKVDGGERRKAEVRAKRAAAERKNAR